MQLGGVGFDPPIPTSVSPTTGSLASTSAVNDANHAAWSGMLKAQIAELEDDHGPEMEQSEVVLTTPLLRAPFPDSHPPKETFEHS